MITIIIILFLINSTNAITTFTTKNGLINNKVSSIVIDKDNVWFGTPKGISKYDKKTGKFKNFKKEGVICLASDDRFIWCGTNKGLFRFDKENLKWSHINFRSISKEKINTLYLDSKILWIGTDRGLFKYNRIKNAIIRYTQEQGLINNSVKSIVLDGNNLIVGTVGAAIHSFDKERNIFNVYSPGSKMYTNIVLAVAGDSIYSGTNGGGIRVYNKLTGKWKRFTLKEGISDEFLQAIALDGRYIWFGTFDGVCRYDTKEKKWYILTSKDGLVDGSVSAIAIDGNYIWFGTDNGVSLMNKKSPQIIIELKNSYITSKNTPIVIPFVVRSNFTIKEEKVGFSTSSFPDIWFAKGLKVNSELKSERRLIVWDLKDIPSDNDTYYLKVFAKDVNGNENEHIVNIIVDTVFPKVAVDPFPDKITKGIRTISGKLNKSNIESVVIFPYNVKASINRKKRRFFAILDFKEKGIQKLIVNAIDKIGRIGTASIRVKVVGKETNLPVISYKSITGSKGKLILSEKILFDYAEAQLKKEAYSLLNRVVEILKNNPKTNVKIEGHTDNIPLGKHAKFLSNLELSKARAKSVYMYLIKHGILSARLKIFGFGDSKPIASNDTPQGRAKNRRVEIIITVEE